ncbi:MAG: hypothetical protein LC722_09395 [Actinobacteria bacterium]|nr:hypothetical protein [Actinomycetota bacterium]
MAPRAGLRVLGNRGASGIDGFVASVLGASVTGAPAYALAGDLSLLHDVGSLIWNARRGFRAAFVVANNDGGGIFSFLPQAALPEFAELFATPHGADLAGLAQAAGARHVRLEAEGDLANALLDRSDEGGVSLIEVRTHSPSPAASTQPTIPAYRPRSTGSRRSMASAAAAAGVPHTAGDGCMAAAR